MQLIKKLLVISAFIAPLGIMNAKAEHYNVHTNLTKNTAVSYVFKSDGSPAKNTKIILENASGKTVKMVKTDHNGRAIYSVPPMKQNLTAYVHSKKHPVKFDLGRDYGDYH